MNAFLFGDSSDEGEERNIVFQLLTFEIFLLQKTFRLKMGSRSFGSKDAETLIFSNSIGERERMWVFP